jgi:hypothetical protein
VLSAEEIMHIKMFRHVYGQDAEMHIEDEATGDTYSITQTAFNTFPAKAHVKHDDDNPTFGQARKSENWPKWLEAILKEYAGLEEHGTWEITKLPRGERPLNVKLVLKRKRGADGEIIKYKARLVVLGNEMKDIDMLSELFAPVGQQITFKCMGAGCAQFNLEWKQLDFSQAFVQSEIHGAPVYIKQGPGRQPALDENGQPCALKLINRCTDCLLARVCGTTKFIHGSQSTDSSHALQTRRCTSGKASNLCCMWTIAASCTTKACLVRTTANFWQI